jgi:hypothetical protein
MQAPAGSGRRPSRVASSRACCSTPELLPEERQPPLSSPSFVHVGALNEVSGILLSSFLVESAPRRRARAEKRSYLERTAMRCFMPVDALSASELDRSRCDPMSGSEVLARERW